MFMRLWLQKRVDPTVAKRQWTIYDVLDAHEALDVEADIEELAARQTRRK